MAGLVVLVCGGRDFSDCALVDRVLSVVKPDVIIHGDARGADRLASIWGYRNPDICKRVIAVKADWATHRLAAGPIRNARIIKEYGEHISLVVRFHGGRGTNDMVNRSIAAGLRVLSSTDIDSGNGW